MFRVIGLSTVFALGMTAVSATAEAGPRYHGYGYDYRDYYGYRGHYAVPQPPPYNYRPAERVVVVPVPYPVPYVEEVYVRPPNCGVYRYWDGYECVDAREVPPPLDRD